MVTDSISDCEPVRGPYLVTQNRTMPVQESDGENGSCCSGTDPHQSKSDANSLLHFNDNYVSGADSGVEGTPQKKIDEQEGLSGTTDFQRYSVPRFGFRL